MAAAAGAAATPEEVLAATRVQSRQRGRAARKLVGQDRQEQSRAASRIQSRYRARANEQQKSKLRPTGTNVNGAVDVAEVPSGGLAGEASAGSLGRRSGDGTSSRRSSSPLATAEQSPSPSSWTMAVGAGNVSDLLSRGWVVPRHLGLDALGASAVRAASAAEIRCVAGLPTIAIRLFVVRAQALRVWSYELVLCTEWFCCVWPLDCRTGWWVQRSRGLRAAGAGCARSLSTEG